MPTDGIIALNAEKDMTARVVAIDLNGTLLTPHKTLLPSSPERYHAPKKRSFQLIIVTGRHHVAIHPFYQALALETPPYLLYWHLFV